MLFFAIMLCPTFNFNLVFGRFLDKSSFGSIFDRFFVPAFWNDRHPFSRYQKPSWIVSEADPESASEIYLKRYLSLCCYRFWPIFSANVSELPIFHHSRSLIDLLFQFFAFSIPHLKIRWMAGPEFSYRIRLNKDLVKILGCKIELPKSSSICYSVSVSR